MKSDIKVLPLCHLLFWMSLSFIDLDLNNSLFFRTIVHLFVFGFQGTDLATGKQIYLPFAILSTQCGLINASHLFRHVLRTMFQCKPLNLRVNSTFSVFPWNALLIASWRWWDSNSWPPACKAGALPTELHPQSFVFRLFWCFLILFWYLQSSHFEWAWMDSNHRPHAYQACALTSWATSPKLSPLGLYFLNLAATYSPTSSPM